MGILRILKIHDVVCLFVRSLLDPDAHKLTALAVAIKPLHLAVLHVDAARPSAELLTASAAVIRPDQANRSAQELLQLEEAQEAKTIKLDGSDKRIPKDPEMLEQQKQMFLTTPELQRGL